MEQCRAAKGVTLDVYTAETMPRNNLEWNTLLDASKKTEPYLLKKETQKQMFLMIFTHYCEQNKATYVQILF